jgi:UDP-glucose 4-epimerase
VRVLVTGGSGFIGTHVVDALSACGHKPRVFDLVRSPYADDRTEIVVGDLLDADALRDATGGCDAVVHLAAVADVNAVEADPARADLVNVRGTHAALEAARATGVRRFVYASTIWVYDGADANGHPLDEDARLVLPSHFYTATKLAGEMYCRSFAELYGLQQVTLRFGIPYGPRSRRAAVVAAFVERARTGQPLVIAGDGSQARQFVHVKDLAQGVVAALEDDVAPGVYNLVGPESVTIRDVAKHVKELVLDVPTVHIEARKADVKLRPVSGERATRVLGWSPRTPFDEGVRDYVDWVNETSGSPRAVADSMIAGRAAVVLRQEPEAL